MTLLLSSDDEQYWTVPTATVMAAGPSLVEFWAQPASTLNPPAPRAPRKHRPRRPRWI